jgi:ankyrin repeat protein
MSVSAEKGALLHAAVRKNEVTEIRALLKGNAALVDFQEDGLTPLMSALSRGRRDGNVNAFECLLAYRPNLNIKNKVSHFFYQSESRTESSAVSFG